MTTDADHLVDDYLKRLDGELSDLPRERRRELTEEIAGHIAEARADLDPENEAEIRNLLERLGDPAEIAAEERARSGLVSRRAGPVEIAALIGLLVGGFVFVIGWFVGLVLLWVSEAWSLREKLVGTLLVPGGLLPAFLILTGAVGLSYTEGCSGDVDPVTGAEINVVCTTGGPSLAAQIAWAVVSVVCLVGPFFTTAFLLRRLRRPASTYQPSAGSA
jgi:uncharacterized membrane protein